MRSHILAGKSRSSAQHIRRSRHRRRVANGPGGGADYAGDLRTEARRDNPAILPFVRNPQVRGAAVTRADFAPMRGRSASPYTNRTRR
jgi:hypothetical protein